MPTLKHKLTASDARLSMHVCTIPSATVPQAMAAAGADAVIIDLEHGAIDYATAHAMVAATQGFDCAPTIRIAENDAVLVKRALDMGAEGIVFPLIDTAEDAARAVASMRYPPNGTRGFGPFIAHSRWGVPMLDYRTEIEPELCTILLIETRAGVANIDAIVDVPGIDLIVPAQFDLSTALGISGQFDHPEFIAAVDKVETACKRAGTPLGGVAMAKPQADMLIARGYRVVAGFDLLWLKAKTAETQSWLAE